MEKSLNMSLHKDYTQVDKGFYISPPRGGEASYSSLNFWYTTRSVIFTTSYTSTGKFKLLSVFSISLCTNVIH